jgi:NADH:ubiquinone reductase (H+-translocating)
MTDAPADQSVAKAAPNPNLHRIVIVGGGAGGIELVTRLGDTFGRSGRADIALVEQARTHLWKPLLHEVAAGSMDVSRHELDYLAQAHWHNFRFRLGEMIGLDRARRVVNLAAKLDEDGRLITPVRSIGYDTLVIAIGSVSNDFGTPGVKEHAICLDTPEEAARFNRRLVNACLRAHTQAEPVRPGQLHVAIIGAGATGTELSAELHRTVRGVVAFGLDKIDPDKDIKITLIEAADRLVPALPKRLSDATARLLGELGVEIRTGARVTEVGPDGVHLAGGDFIASELVVWSAGVRGPDVLKNLDGLEASASGQLVVRPTLQTTRDDDVFALGDCASCTLPGHSMPVPPRAQAAHQEASLLVRSMVARLQGKKPPDFVYRDFGSLVSFGSYSTIGSLMGALVGGSLRVEGWFAGLMYRSLYKLHRLALEGFWPVAFQTMADLIARRIEPRIKLH